MSTSRPVMPQVQMERQLPSPCRCSWKIQMVLVSSYLCIQPFARPLCPPSPTVFCSFLCPSSSISLCLAIVGILYSSTIPRSLLLLDIIISFLSFSLSFVNVLPSIPVLANLLYPFSSYLFLLLLASSTCSLPTNLPYCEFFFLFFSLAVLVDHDHFTPPFLPLFLLFLLLL